MKVRIGKAAEMLNMPIHKLRKLADDGKIDCTRTEGGQRMFDVKDINLWGVQLNKAIEAVQSAKGEMPKTVSYTMGLKDETNTKKAQGKNGEKSLLQRLREIVRGWLRG